MSVRKKRHLPDTSVPTMPENAGTPAPLVNRWRTLWLRQGMGGETPDSAVLVDLAARYAAPDRHYHTLTHVQHCLRELDGIASLAHQPDLVEAAIWFHDCIYDPRRHDNEERSAELAAEIMLSFGMPPEAIKKVRQLILATRHDLVPDDPDAQLLVDIDLAILGAPAPLFDAYEMTIRLEYAHVPGAAFRAGRAAVLRSFLERPWIYTTDPIRQRYEQQARQNLTRSLERLAAGPF